MGLVDSKTIFGANNENRTGLPPWTYNNAELTELETREIFLKNWTWAGHISDLPEPGHYKCIDIAGEKAILVRGEDNKIRAFHNYCRHRGARLVRDDQGKCGNSLICPFHGWSYHLDGRLKNIPRPDSFPDIDQNTMGLKSLDCEIWHGMIFLRFAGDGPSIHEVFSDAEEEISLYNIAEMKPYDEPWHWDFDFDWKLVVDIDNEGYHLPTGHPELFDLVGKTYNDKVYSSGIARASGSFANRKVKTPANRNYIAALPDDSYLPDSHAKEWIYWGSFPGFVITLFPDMIEIYQVYPTGFQHSKMAGRCYALPDDRPEMEKAREFNREINMAVGNEDVQLIQWASEAMQSSAFDGLLLSDLEIGVGAFQNQMRQKLPVVTLKNPPASGELKAINQEMLA
ncbi:MAG: phenylpropionate dioxygenase-like ring-hydroxylating dioxygenase large terminal subunit [Gammaproteobacteria bacterium]|jgi:phenylpropionate dioxygenase-like ring-hydroxylating dioxygenase large terminal subunit